MKLKFFDKSFYFLADEQQINKALGMIKHYILKPEVLSVLILVVVYFISLIVAKIKKNEKILKLLKKVSPWMYLLIILGITVLNRATGTREIRLYHDLWITATGFHESNVLGFMFNLVLYVPFGYLLNKYGKTTIAVIVVFFSSFIIEATQYILARGVTAIDDLLANTLGGIIGIGLAIVLQKLKKIKTE